MVMMANAVARAEASMPAARPRPAVQAKLRIGAVDDPLEYEADRIADDVVSDRPVGGISGVPSDTAQRKCSECEAEEEESVQRQCAGCAAGERIPGQSADQAANAVAQGGAPLTPEQRAYFEPRFGRDFSGVRVHTHGGVTDAARAINARAYTLGSDIAFDAGAYDSASLAGRRLLAHELTHVVQQEQAGTEAATVRRQRRQGPAVTTPREQQRRFIEAFNANPRAALADVANMLEIGGGQFEVYGLVYIDNETGKLEIVRMLTAEHRAIFDQVRRLRARQVTDVDLEMDETQSLLQSFDRMTGVQAWLENTLSIRPSRALEVLARVQAQLDADRQGYPAVSDADLGNVESAIEAISHSHAFPIPVAERPRPEGRTLLGYFHTHPTTMPPSGIRGVPSAGGDIGVATEEGQGSFLITGTPDQPLIYFIADGKYWDLSNGLRNALERQVSFVAGFDRALGGAFGELAFGAAGFGIRARASERPGLRINQGFNIGDYRLTLAGELNPAIASGDFALRGRPETRRLLEASPLAGELEFSFRNQPFIPGSVSLQVLSAGAVRVEGRIDPIPVPMDLEFVGGATLFEGVAGLELEGFVGVEMRPGLPLPLLPGGVGVSGRYVPGSGLHMNVFYENPWMRVDYAAPSRSGDEGGVLSTSFSYRLPTGTLRVQLGYGDQLFGNIGYQVRLR